jgi:uncharacterized protein YndB with AHSA1/START domain
MTRTGTLRMDGDRCVLRFERRLAHPVAKVWRAITDPEHLAHWYPMRRELEPAVGGKVREGDPAAPGVIHGTVTEYDPPRVLEYTLSTEGVPMAGFGDRRTSRFELSPDPIGCLLVFTHTFSDRAGAASFATGWQGCLDALESLLSGARLERFDRWTEHHEEYVRRFGLAEGTVRETAGGGWVVCFERQLMGAPVEKAWAELTASDAAGTAVDADGTGSGGLAVEALPPLRFTNGYVPAGAVTEVEPPSLLEYRWLAPDAEGGENGTGGEHAANPEGGRGGGGSGAEGDSGAGAAGGRVRWELAHGPGGARITLTQTGTARLSGLRAVALAAWHTHLELFADHLAGNTRCWPRDRTEELRRHYAALL